MINIYKEIILDHYKNPRNYGSLNSPTASIKVNNPLCGDEIEMQVIIKEEKVKEIRFKGLGCVISQAASSLLTEYAKGKSKDQLQKIDKEFMIKLLGIDLGPNRIKCALLPLEALKKLLLKV